MSAKFAALVSKRGILLQLWDMYREHKRKHPPARQWVFVK
jgi:hypothetical protein